jgi:virginiamycin B lyase
MPSRRARLLAAGVAAGLVLGACGRGVPEERVSLRAAHPGDVAGSAPVTSTTEPAVAAPPLTTATTGPPPMPPPASSGAAGAGTTPPPTARPAPGDACGAPTTAEFALPPGTKPAALASGPDGSIWFTDWGAASVGRLGPDGAVRLFPVSGGRQPSGIAVDRHGDVWFTESAAYRPGPAPGPGTGGPPAIGQLTAEGAMTEFPLPTTQANPMGVPDMGSSPLAITAGPDDALWFTEAGADQIGRITAEGIITEYPLPSRSRMHANPEGITAGPDGAVWFTEALANQLGRIGPASGAITEFTTFPPAQRGISQSLAAGSDGAVWFDNINAAVVGSMTTAGKVTVVPLPDRYKPTSVVAGPDGRPWFFDQQKPAVVRLTASGRPADVTVVPGGPNQYVGSGAMVLDGIGRLWFAEGAAGRIGRIDCGPAAAGNSTRGVV